MTPEYGSILLVSIPDESICVPAYPFPPLYAFALLLVLDFL